jgi:general secretion pathway protein N
MSRGKLLVAAGVAAFVVFVVALMPATLLLRWLPAGIAVSGIDGTIWSGHAASVSVHGRSIGPTVWSCRPWRLVFLEWTCRVLLRPPGGELSAALSGGFDGRIEGQDITGRVPIALLEGVVSPPGWNGWLEIDGVRLSISGGQPTDAGGRVLVRGLRAPPPDGATLGDFELLIGEGVVGAGKLTGRLRDLGGPLRVRGTIELKGDRSYLMSGEVAPGPGADAAIFDTLAILGPPDSQGRREFAVEGTL